jgi:hypothetical protein
VQERSFPEKWEEKTKRDCLRNGVPIGIRTSKDVRKRKLANIHQIGLTKCIGNSNRELIEKSHFHEKYRLRVDLGKKNPNFEYIKCNPESDR